MVYALLLLTASSCDIHQYPDDDEPIPTIGGEHNFTVKVHHELDMDDYVYRVDSLNSRSNTFIDYTYDEDVSVRYIMCIFDADKQGQCIYKQYYYNDNLSLEDFTVNLVLPSEVEYDDVVYVWSDFVDRETHNPIYYNASNFRNVTYTSRYVADTRSRDCFEGWFNLSQVKPKTKATEPTELEVDLTRPVGIYTVVATDLDKFTHEYLNGASLKDYRVEVRYPSYTPYGIDILDNDIVDVSTSVKYNSSILVVNDKVAILGYDYSFLNTSDDAGVDIQLYLIKPDGSEKILTKPIRVPMRRNQHTYVVGPFLTSAAQAGFNIDYKYTSDYNIYLYNIF
jgi:hypothetical protein